MQDYLKQLQDSLEKTNQSLSTQNHNAPLITTSVGYLNQQGINIVRTGNQFVSVVAELTPPNQQFVDAWRKNIPMRPELEKITVSSPKGGPPGKDIDIAISGTSTRNIKIAASQLKQALSQFAGVSNIQDDLPEGKEHLNLTLKPQAHALKLSQKSISQQVAHGYQGHIIQRFYQGPDETEVTVRLPKNERENFTSLAQFPIKTPLNTMVGLNNVASFTFTRGFELIRQQNGLPTTHVTAEVNSQINNSNRILKDVQQYLAPPISQQYGVTLHYEGKAKEQRETLADMKMGLVVALTLIYLILSAVFSSYSWPIIIMLIIPIGLTGGILGHFFLGINFTILSLFGFFGLAGIVINDSIILINRYRKIRKDPRKTPEKAMLEASCQRLRAVMLTSLTTIAGLLPIIFESSLQAQFLIPMAVTICCGLAYATLLILLVVPAALMTYETWQHPVKN